MSTRGDKRFSALTAWLRRERRTIEQVYQCDVKQIDPGGRNWRAGKGRAPLDPTINLYSAYLGLWRQWARENPALIEELRILAAEHDYVLSDRFASSEVSQARALADILNETET